MLQIVTNIKAVLWFLSRNINWNTFYR